jgi:hypothetical protein
LIPEGLKTYSKQKILPGIRKMLLKIKEVFSVKRKVLLSFFIIIFILSSLVVILAGDLTKEQIVNEFKKITVIVNKDVRLEMYDILARKLGLKIAEDSIIKEWSGNGTKTTRPITIKTAWEIQCNAKKGIIINLYDKDGNFVKGVASQMEAGKGSSYVSTKGTFCLEITSFDDWGIKIVEVK